MAILLAISVILLAILSGDAAAAIDGSSNEENSLLHVNGIASLSFPADSFEMSIQVESNKNDAQSALRENNVKMEDIVVALAKLGLKAKTDYSTGYFSINPVYRTTNVGYGRMPGERFDDDNSQREKEVIAGYQAFNTVNIFTDKLNLIGDIIDACNAAGATRIDGLSFVLKHPESVQNLVLEKAIKNGKEKAMMMANAAGVKLGKLLNIDGSGNDFGYNNYQPRMMMKRNAEMMMMASNDVGTSIESHDISLSSTVSMTYEIIN